MRILIYVFFAFSLIVVSCGRSKTSPTLQSVGANSKTYRGYNIIAASEKCAVPSEDRICPSGHNELGLMNIDFAQICESKNARAYDCGCKEKYLCSIKLDVLISGYDIEGRKKRAIPHSDIIECPDSGSFPPDTTDKLQEDFRSRCESLGHIATLTGCSIKRYLCSSKI